MDTDIIKASGPKNISRQKLSLMGYTQIESNWDIIEGWARQFADKTKIIISRAEKKSFDTMRVITEVIASGDCLLDYLGLKRIEQSKYVSLITNKGSNGFRRATKRMYINAIDFSVELGTDIAGSDGKAWLTADEKIRIVYKDKACLLELRNNYELSEILRYKNYVEIGVCPKGGHESYELPCLKWCMLDGKRFSDNSKDYIVKSFYARSIIESMTYEAAFVDDDGNIVSMHGKPTCFNIMNMDIIKIADLYTNFKVNSKVNLRKLKVGEHTKILLTDYESQTYFVVTKISDDKVRVYADSVIDEEGDNDEYDEINKKYNINY